MQQIKKLFFTYRNGAMADTLRRYGIPHKVIFGLEIPRIAEIARDLPQDFELAEKLWGDREVRESRLLATYLFPPESIDMQKAMQLAADTRTQEESDMLAFRLLKRLPMAREILSQLEAGNTEALQRTAGSLRRHLED